MRLVCPPPPSACVVAWQQQCEAAAWSACAACAALPLCWTKTGARRALGRRVGLFPQAPPAHARPRSVAWQRRRLVILQLAVQAMASASLPQPLLLLLW